MTQPSDLSRLLQGWRLSKMSTRAPAGQEVPESKVRERSDVR